MSSENNKDNEDENNDVIIYTKKSEQVSSRSAISNTDSINKISNKSRSKNKRIEENKNNNQSIKSKISINSHISLNSNRKLKVDRNEDPKQTFKLKRESVQSMIEDKEQQDEEVNESCRQKFKNFCENNNRINYLEMVVCFISFLSFIFYVICTYMNKLFKYLNYADYFICFYFIICHIIYFIINNQPLNYLISADSLIFFILEIPPLFSNLCSDFHFSWLYRFINITRVMRTLKVVNLIDIFIGIEINDITNQIIVIITNLLILVLILGGLVQIFDLRYVEDMLKITYDTFARKNLLLRRHFHHYIYFSIITLTTVGYGDIFPKEIFSKVTVMIISIFMLFYVPQQIDKLLTLSNNQTIYQRKSYIYIENVPFVVLVGDIQLDSLKSFCQEYFHKDHGDNLRQIVILANEPPSKSMELFLNYKDNSKFITYLQGKYNEDNDLLRSGILNAKSCIIFTNRKNLDHEMADSQSLMLALSMKKFYYYNVDKNKKIKFKICLQLNKQENCKHYFLALQDIYKREMPQDILLVIESFKMNLLSKSCLTPGIISLISNLVISSGTKTIKSMTESDWMKEYIEGQQYEIYKYNSLRGELLFLSFQEIAKILYMRYHAILIALEIVYKGGILVKLNPQSKETIIDILYLSIFSKTKNTSMNDGFNNNPEEQEGDSLLDIYEQGSDDELESRKYKKFYNLSFKHLEINIYCISSDESIISNIKKLDEQKEANLDKSENAYSKLGSYIDKYSQSNKRYNLTRQRTRIKFDSDDESDFYNDEQDNNSVKHLINIEDNPESYEDELLKDYYSVDDVEKDSLSNMIINKRIKEYNDIKNHIIICGTHPELIQFILPLRSKSIPIKLLKWIVILTPNLPQEIHDKLSKFPKIIYIQGDPLNPNDLMRANVIVADIAIILGAYSNMENNDNENYEVIGRENEEKKEEENKTNDDDMIEDQRVLYIYGAIKKLNNSIQIITELLYTKNIELLLSSKSLKKLYDDSKSIHMNSNSSQSIISNENDDKSNLNYDITPVYAAGEVYLPTLIDRITSQISFNSNLLRILNLILIGERPPEKLADKKLAQMVELSGSNLYLIPCEPKSESFGDMFKRLLIKYSMISIALYRKNELESFNYIYTNPKKTTLVRKNDMVFVLTSTENLISYYEKNLFLINTEGKSAFNDEENNQINNEDNNIENNMINEKGPPFSKVFQEAIEQQIDKNSQKKITKFDKKLTVDNLSTNNNSLINLFDVEEKKERKYNSVFHKNEIKRGKYSEIDNIQNRLNKGIEKLNLINQQCNKINEDIQKSVDTEISNEFCVYVPNANTTKSNEKKIE